MHASPLATLRRHGARFLLLPAALPGMPALAGECRFASPADALAFLRGWRADASALAGLRGALRSAGGAGPVPTDDDAVLHSLARLLAHGRLQLVDADARGLPLARLKSVVTNASPSAALAGAGGGSKSGGGLMSMMKVPSLPKLPPLLPALEDVRIEGVDVLPEIKQSIDNIQASLGSVAGASASLAPTPDKLPPVKDSMSAASAELRSQLDEL
ncbi:hypothetical protein [Derxia gummosa]|uniref:Uncharacterized protein n=1 Tax=Derxia gummosa DSM 723 TaxID=1121388 RepID=A0A8B6X5B3_9BURK|nr:hypothetical protein [Derxia gummosa]